MIAAAWPRDEPRATRLLHIDPDVGSFADFSIGDLRTLLREGDLVVVNDAATLPASLSGMSEAGEPIEARLTGWRESQRWRAVLFGAGDWRTRTEDRPPPGLVKIGDAIQFGGAVARVVHVDKESPRVVDLTFEADDDALWQALYRAGRPVQYAYTANALALWHVQTVFAGRPTAAEAPSAAFALTWDLLLDLKRRGVGIARLTHAAGLSSTGDERLDARLPCAESYEIPEETVRAISAAKANGGRVLAVGTTVTRALEGAAINGQGHLRAGGGTTEVLVGPRTQRQIVDGILTGVHETNSSHFRLLQSFASRSLLERAHEHAEAEGYLGHEFGDVVLILGKQQSVRKAART